MINTSNSTSKNNPRWRLAESPGSARPAQPAQPPAAARETAGQSDPARFGRILAIAVRVALSWLAAIPRRLGDLLFAMNDTEAYWRDWQITRTQGGLGRSYRDPRFDTLAECPKCRGAGFTAAGAGAIAGGAGLTAGLPCLPCLGTGRVTLGEVS